MWEDEEYQDFEAFEEALSSLSEAKTLAAIENAAQGLFQMKIGICFTKLGSRELEFYFVVRSEAGRNVLGLSLSSLITKIAGILDYDGIFIKKEATTSARELKAQYSEVIEICPDNFERINNVANAYRNYLKDKMAGTGKTCFQQKPAQIEQRSSARALSQFYLTPAVSKKSQSKHKRLKSESGSEETLAADPKLEGELMDPLKEYVSQHPERSDDILSELSSFCSKLKRIK